ncbi:hypothetical protein PY365_31015 [Roseiarcaceae bacterium H3SJ34-1]|uniref:hypothetical protein n=1 Tax=Terripilifer ovatus TaxID=3032367 RepID=UPI003AB93C11|nr:hypothetical protein [Roseiarcaceae bacterium H3SJ34-1]
MRKIVIAPRVAFLAFAAAAATAVPALAQQADSADQQNGRYTMTPAPDGFLRLDTRTGAVSLCTSAAGNVQCRASADERGALDQEITRLSNENADLRKKLAAATDQAPSARLRNALPTDAEVNGALDQMEKFMRRMMRIMREEAPAPRDRT